MVDGAIFPLLVFGPVICSYRAVTAARILTSTIYLAAVTAAVTMPLCRLGAYRMAVNAYIPGCPPRPEAIIFGVVKRPKSLQAPANPSA